MTQRDAGRITVNPVACTGHGLCAELLPELISLDEWGYPVVTGTPVPAALTRQARRAVRDCPALALRLAGPGPGPVSGEVAAGSQRSFRKNAESPQNAVAEWQATLAE